MRRLDRFTRREAPATQWRDAPTRFRRAVYVAGLAQVATLCSMLARPVLAVGLFGSSLLFIGAPLVVDLDGAAQWRARYLRARGRNERGPKGSRLFGGYLVVLGAAFLSMAFGLWPR